MNKSKKCTRCNEVKTIAEFSGKRGGTDSRCKTCASEVAKNYRDGLKQRLEYHESIEWQFTLKRCPECDIEKPHLLFPRSRSNKSGVQTYCRDCHKKRRKPPNRSIVRSRYAMTKAGARRRKKEFSLSSEQYWEIVGPNECEYCGGTLPTAGGLDRLDNSIGYIPGNCVACCTICNSAKGSAFTYDEMKVIGRVIRDVLDRRVAETKPFDRCVQTAA